MTNLPVTVVEAEAVPIICHWIDLVAQLLTSDAARLVLRNHIRERLRQGTIPRMQVIAAAEAGHQDADLALRELAAEHISRREEMPTELANYVQRALLMPPATYPPGRNLADTWLRDIGIAVMVDLAAARWGVLVSRSHHRKPGSKRLSACYLVSAALNRAGHAVRERQVERIHASHGRLAQRLSASIPPI
jgi:hypothetical protein